MTEPHQGLLLVVDDIEAARDDLVSRGVDVGEIWHLEPGKGPVARPRPRAPLVLHPRDLRRPGRQPVAAPGGRRAAARPRRAHRPAPRWPSCWPRPRQHHGAFEAVAAQHNWWDWYAAYLAARQDGDTPAQADNAADAYMEEALRRDRVPLRAEPIRRTRGPRRRRGPLHVIRAIAAPVGQRRAELPARADAELPEHLAQVPLDRARAEEELGADLGVRAARRRASCAICASCGVRSSSVSTVRLRTVSPVASSSRRARSAKTSMPISVSISCAMRSCSRASTRRFSRRSHSP